MFGGLGSYLARHFHHHLKASSFYSIVSLIALCSILGMGLGRGVIVVLLAMLVQSLLHGLMYPAQNMYINPHLPNEYRSGILSLQSLLRSCVNGVAVMITGALAEGLGLVPAILIIGLLPLIIILLQIVRLFQDNEQRIWRRFQ